MSGNITGSGTRYTVARNAVNQIVQANQSNIRFGLEIFGMYRGTTPSCGISSPTCNYPTPDCASVQADFNTADSIAATLVDAGAPQGGTPTWTAVDESSKRADLKDGSRPRFNLLVTDGDPSGCGAANGTEVDLTVASINGIRADAGVRTFVLGFAGGAPANLSRMAIAGGAAKPGCDAGTPASCYYVANNASDLQNALSQIVQTVTSELGTAGGCDETCYASGCGAGQICKASACIADPCSGVTCGSGEACVEGACKKSCETSCGNGRYCDNGVCKDEVPCAGGCNGRNQICVGGSCVENYCTGSTYKISCPAGDVCSRNGCSPPNVLPDGGVVLPDGGTGSSGTSTGVGCCSGAPEAFSALALAIGLAALAARRRRAP